MPGFRSDALLTTEQAGTSAINAKKWAWVAVFVLLVVQAVQMASVVHRESLTFDEDKVIIEAQYANMKRFPAAPVINIGADAGPARARRIIERLTSLSAAEP